MDVNTTTKQKIIDFASRKENISTHLMMRYVMLKEQQTQCAMLIEEVQKYLDEVEQELAELIRYER